MAWAWLGQHLLPMIRSWVALVALAAAAAAGPVARPACPLPSGPVQLPKASESGYLQIDAQGSKLFFLFVEPSASDSSAPLPITLWLQVICEATGMMFEQRGGPRQHMPVTRVQPAAAAAVALHSQGGPGCSSLFGAFYELGPQLVDEGLGLQANPGAAARVCGIDTQLSVPSLAMPRVTRASEPLQPSQPPTPA